MAATPLMDQYHKVKEENPDTILLFRVGDFFETFEDDAKLASKTLGITLTKRSNGKTGETPLAGFPHHALDSYLPKLVRAGLRVAICEQVENPKFAKGIVKREVTEVVTPGVAFSDKLLDHRKNNYLMSAVILKDIAGISFCDISTGEFFLYEVHKNDFHDQLSLINPSEILIPKSQKEIFEPLVMSYNSACRITRLDDWLFGLDHCKELLLGHFKTKTLKGFGVELMTNGIISAGVIINYLRETQKANLPHIANLAIYNPSDYMILDYATKRNLEITFSISPGEKEGTLINILDKTCTPMGARLLKKWISAPLRKLLPIKQRLECVEEFVGNGNLRKNIYEELKEIGDLERLISKVCTGRINPRELVNLKTSLKKIPLLKQLLDVSSSPNLQSINQNLHQLTHITEKIELAIKDDPPTSITDGGVIREGFNEELDELRSLSGNAKEWISNLVTSERERTGIPSLKVSYNKVFGYYIEISNTHKNKVPENYIRKQTLVNSERYITPELKEYEDKVINAEENIGNLEYNIYTKLRNEIAKDSIAIQQNAKLIAMLDCYVSNASCAVEYNYSKPQLNESDALNIKNGRHPVVERILPPGEKFTGNDCNLANNTNQIIVLTGPNMAGKSVYLRQTGLLVLMAQAGCYVPADSLEMGLIDRIYTRVGASDNISAGESTFLVEMQEAANILNNTTAKSLILLDEIGRGTSTFDGISIAWAITEYLHENPNVAAKTLFATHYHELNEMADLFPRIKNFKVEVREIDDKVIFLHKVSEGGADHSYGIQVAQMAGLPKFVTSRAKEILENLEGKELTPYEVKKQRIAKNKGENDIQFNLFEVKDDKFREEVSSIDVDGLTPLQALNKLSELKSKIDNEKKGKT